jgi:hypothetical protein
MPMEKELNHECIICGVKYHHCDSCNQISTFTPWRVICDTAEHYQIYMVILDYQSNTITKEEAKEQLNTNGVTLNSIESFKDSTKGILKEILADDIQEDIVTVDEVTDTKKFKIKE